MRVTSTMMDEALTITRLLEHGRRNHGHREVVTRRENGLERHALASTYQRIRRLATGLGALGVADGDVVATLCWNHQEHLEAYFAVPCSGAVLHPLNLRLSPRQLAGVVDDLGGRVVIVDDVLVELLAETLEHARSPRTFVVVGDGDASALRPHGEVVRYGEVLAAGPEPGPWPRVDEHQAAAACHTSGTTGAPKGVVYSHRSIWTHTYGALAGGFRLRDADRLLLAVPLFHANAWGLVHIAWLQGTSLLLPGPHPGPEDLATLIVDEAATCAAAVPTVLSSLLAVDPPRGPDLASLRWVLTGGSAVAPSLIEAFEHRHDIDVVQAWGMTEMSPSGAVAVPQPDADPDRAREQRLRSGRLVSGIEVRLIGEDGRCQPFDGASPGEIQVRGPWVTGRYHRDADPDAFDDGWLRTGDVGVVDERGYLQLVDRTKDLVKSGGEWISSVALEAALQSHPDVRACAVVARADEHWSERPVACVVPEPGRDPDVDELDHHLSDLVARWWRPDAYAVITELPTTSVGKPDKRRLRETVASGELALRAVTRAIRD